MTRSVLILSHPEDVHADAVQVHLDAAGVQVHRLDTAHFATGVHLVARIDSGGLRGEIGGCDLTRVGCVWHRRPSDFGLDDPLATAELRAAVGGVLAALPHLNHPADMARAAFKPYQLAVSAFHGLPVPDTVVTTDLSAATAMAWRHGGAVVVKPMGPGRTITAADGSQTLTRLVIPDGRAGWDEPAHLTQQRIDKAYDVRLTVVDDDLIAVRIDSTLLDWRADKARTHRPVQVPERVAGPVRAVMRHLRLRYAAWDLMAGHDGAWWLSEINPNGQWLWLEEEVGVPIAAAIARALTRPPPPNPNGRHEGR